jgi:Ras family protein
MSTYTDENMNNITTTLISIPNENRPTKRRKILVLGSPGVGKSAIIMRFKDDIFLDYYDPTIHSTIKKLLFFNNENVELEIIDIDGQTEYTIFSFSKFSFGIHGYLLSYSIENRQSFELLKIIHSKLVAMVGRDVPKVLIANKCDLLNRREISLEEGKAFAKKINCPFIECSAKSNSNINKVFHSMLVEINKFESSVDLKGLTCNKLNEFFVKKENILIRIFYTLMILNIVNYYNTASWNNRYGLRILFRYTSLYFEYCKVFFI